MTQAYDETKSPRLFGLPEHEPNPIADTNYQAIGAATQNLAIATLLSLGHKVAVPVTDDDGVDLIVNYRTLVQVKSSSLRLNSGALLVRFASVRAKERRHRGTLRSHIDFVLVYARDVEVWWVLPRSTVPELAAGLSISHKEEPYRGAWHLLD